MDFSQSKKLVIPEGEVAKITDESGSVLWQAITYTNQVPISTDTDGSIYNGLGYKDNVRLSSSGGVSSSAQNGSVTTGFIPWYGDTTYLRMKGVEMLGLTSGISGMHLYINFYDSNKTFMQNISMDWYVSSSWDHIMSFTRDDNGVETIKFSETYSGNGYLNNVRAASFIRITAKGQGANMIVTLNEEIE